MKKQFNIGDLIIWTLDDTICYITQISKDETVSVIYMEEPGVEYYHPITQLSNFSFTKQMVHYPIIPEKQ